MLLNPSQIIRINCILTPPTRCVRCAHSGFCTSTPDNTAESDWLIDWLIDRLIDWLIRCFLYYSLYCKVVHMTDWLTDWLTDRLFDFNYSSIFLIDYCNRSIWWSKISTGTVSTTVYRLYFCPYLRLPHQCVSGYTFCIWFAWTRTFPLYMGLFVGKLSLTPTIVQTMWKGLIRIHKQVHVRIYIL